MKKISGGHLVVKVLETEGVEQVFCVPGESYLGVLDGLYENNQIHVTATRHESGAAFMAEGYAKASNKVGVCMATRGPGAMNLSIGLHTAMQDSTPLVAIIGQVERPFIGKEAFQEVDFANYFKPLCKDSVEINDVERIPELLHQAFYKARSGRPGPVVISVPHDMLEDYGTYKESRPIEYKKPIADTPTIQSVIDEIQRAKEPIVIAGGGIILANAQEELAAFSEALKLPVASAFRRFNVISNEHEHYAGWLGFGANPALLNTISSSDLVVVLGSRLSQVTTQNYTLIHDGTKIIQVDIAEAAIGKAYQPDLAVISDVKYFLQQALSLVRQETFFKEIDVQKVHHDYVAHSTLPEVFSNKPFADLNSVMKDLMKAVPKDSIITSDAGNFYGWLARYFRFTSDRSYIGPTSGAMGYGLPSAIGVKTACPNHTVISISGDGGFMMTMQELETAVRENIKVIAIVVNNNMYGTIRAHQEKQFPDRVIATSLSNPSFSEMAKLYGCEAEVVTENAAFLPAFEAALKSNQSCVIEIQTDPAILSVSQAANK